MQSNPEQKSNGNPILPKIIFMGTPEFAVASLDALVKSGCNIICVITAPDKPAGRGMKPHESAVKKYALEKSLKTLQPEKLKHPDFLNELKKINADMQVVVAFRMLPEAVWNMPHMGTINLHASLLPQYRGAAPINWAIINGEKETGLTTFKLQHEIDTGNILMQEKLFIDDDETAGELHNRMKNAGAELLVKTVSGLVDGSLREISQSAIAKDQSGISNQVPGSLHHAPKIFAETCKIEWNKTADEIYNLIRGLSPYPAAFTFLNNKVLKIYRGKKEIAHHASKPGTVNSDGKTFLKFTCSNGFIHVLDLQLEGKKRMNAEDFLRGYRF